MASSAKTELRSLVKERLSGLSDEAVEKQSYKAQGIISELPQYTTAQRVGIYMSMPRGEAQTDRLIRHSLENGKAVFVPNIYTVGKAAPRRKVMDMLRLESVEEYEGLSRDSWGIPKLAVQHLRERENAMGGLGRSVDTDGTERLCEGGELDVIVVPGVAFDGQMGRLGHGAAFYDTFLARFCGEEKRRKPYLVGLCLAEQLLPPGERLVMQEWDWRVDAIATGDGRLVTLDK